MKGQRIATPMVIWRIIWVVPYATTLILHLVVTTIGFGLDAGKRVWDDGYFHF